MTELKKRKPLTANEKKVITNIKNARKDSNLSQEELSARLAKNSNYMGMVESYRRGISLSTLFKIAEILRVKARTFFDGI